MSFNSQRIGHMELDKPVGNTKDGNVLIDEDNTFKEPDVEVTLLQVNVIDTNAFEINCGSETDMDYVRMKNLRDYKKPIRTDQDGDNCGDNVVSCVGIIYIKHRHNVLRDILVDICFLSRILVGKEVNIGHSDRRDKPLRPADMLLYSWDDGLYVWILQGPHL
nr:hypothetical protein [Tanacetum cinerariifolium]